MTNVFGTNLTTVEASSVKTGQKTVDTTADGLQLTTETGPLTHGIWIMAASGTAYITVGDATTSNSLQVKANNPVWLPIKDPSTLKGITASSTSLLTFVMM